MAYLPNLDQNVLDKNKELETDDVDPTTSSDSIRDEQQCLLVALKLLRRVHRQGGIKATVFGREVNS